MKNKEVRLAAKAAGMKYFLAACPEHGLEKYYTSSGRCMKCTAAAKDCAKQAQYWATVSDRINREKRKKYAQKN